MLSLFSFLSPNRQLQEQVVSAKKQAQHYLLAYRDMTANLMSVVRQRNTYRDALALASRDAARAQEGLTLVQKRGTETLEELRALRHFVQLCQADGRLSSFTSPALIEASKRLDKAQGLLPAEDVKESFEAVRAADRVCLPGGCGMQHQVAVTSSYDPETFAKNLAERVNKQFMGEGNSTDVGFIASDS